MKIVVPLFAALVALSPAGAAPVEKKATPVDTEIVTLVRKMQAVTEAAVQAAREAQAEAERLERENATLRSKLACS